MASSITDYIFRRLALDYLSFDDRLELGLASIDDMPTDQTVLLDVDSVAKPAAEDPANDFAGTADKNPHPRVAKDTAAPLCYNCGNQTQRAGSCYVCTACGSTTGCS
jgi:ribonucleoside-diphosphate reductase alpha chain